MSGARPDGFHIAVPVDWSIPQAGRIPVTSNDGNQKGFLFARSMRLAELLAAPVDLPGALFRASGEIDGDAQGVIVGVYDIGSAVSTEGLEAAIREVSPGAVTTTVAVARVDALLVEAAAVGSEAVGTVAATDCWVPVPGQPTQFTLIRFWGRASAIGGLGRPYEYMIQTFDYMMPVAWSGLFRRLSAHRFRPSKGRAWEKTHEFWLKLSAWRVAGWRLGQVFHSVALTRRNADFLPLLATRPRHGRPLALFFVLWLIATSLFLDFHFGRLFFGAIVFLASASLAPRAGYRAIVVLLVGLAVVTALAA